MSKGQGGGPLYGDRGKIGGCGYCKKRGGYRMVMLKSKAGGGFCEDRDTERLLQEKE